MLRSSYLLFSFFIAATLRTDALAMDQEGNCHAATVRVFNNELLACDSEGISETVITPPAFSALRLAEDGAGRKGVNLAKPRKWPARAIYWNETETNSGYWAEFDHQGNILRSNISAPGSPLVEYQRAGLPIWLGGQHVYAISDSTNTTYPPAFILSNDHVCPARPANTSYEYYRNQTDHINYLSGNCEKSIPKPFTGEKFLIYPEDLSNKWGDSKTNQIHWSVQYFKDPISPLINSNGECFLYCESNHPPPSATKFPITSIESTPGSKPAPLDLRPPSKSTIRELAYQGQVREGLDQEEVSPSYWPVRALFNSRAGIFEFDPEGNLVSSQGKTTIRAVEVRFGGRGGVPIWNTSQQIYRLLPRGKLNEDYSAIAIRTGIIIDGKHACPTQLVAEAFGILHENGALFLNENCSEALKIKIGSGYFWVYPEEKTSEHPQYWLVQYFDDPVTPMLDAEGLCWLYCEK